MLMRPRKSKRKKCFCGLLMIGALTLACRIHKARKAGAGMVEDTSENEDPTVYVTDQGNKFHLSTCPHLQHSQSLLKKSEAIHHGYEACGVCKP